MTRPISNDRVSLPFSSPSGDPMTSSIIGGSANQQKDTLSEPQNSEKPFLRRVWDKFWNFLSSIWDYCFTKPQLRKDKARIATYAGKKSLDRYKIKDAAEIANRHLDNDEIQAHFKKIRKKIDKINYQIWNSKKGSNFEYTDAKSIIELMDVCIQWENSGD